jgi:hypothetical protein
MSKNLPLINADNTDPNKPKSRLSNLEAALLAVLAVQHPKAVDAIDAFSALWRIKYIPTASLSEAMVLLVEAMTNVEALGYAGCFTDGCGVWYALTPVGAQLTVGDKDIQAEIAICALMSHCGGKPC